MKAWPTKNRQPLVDIIAGARPNFMKIAPIIRAMEARRGSDDAPKYRLVHTGQHYDAGLSGDFFAQLEIPEPHVNLAVGSGTQAEQTAAIMIRYERLLAGEPSDACVVVGDVTSTMACSIVAQKRGVRVAHVEGGIRSGDWTMPEEINRLVTDAITNVFFTTSQFANQNLRASGVSDDRIFFVGNTMIDTLMANMDRLRPPEFWQGMRLQPGEYFVLTLHRPANVDRPSQLRALLATIADAACTLPVVFPVHPRTANTLHGLRDVPGNIRLVEPQPYLEFNYLVKHAKAVLTDSGGITEESTVMGVPCLTLRDTTERPETVNTGTNELVGSDAARVHAAMNRVFSGQWKKGRVPEKWDGKAGERIVSELERLFGRSGS